MVIRCNFLETKIVTLCKKIACSELLTRGAEFGTRRYASVRIRTSVRVRPRRIERYGGVAEAWNVRNV